MLKRIPPDMFFKSWNANKRIARETLLHFLWMLEIKSAEKALVRRKY